MDNMQEVFKEKVNLCDTKYGAVKGADTLALITEWDAFKVPDLTEIKSALRYPVIFDGRNIYNPEILRDFGFEYYSVGR